MALMVRTFGTLMQDVVPNFGNDAKLGWSDNRNMPKNDANDGRYRRKEGRPEWFLAEWLEYLKVSRTALGKRMGRSKSRISELCSGKQRWNSDDLRIISHILGVPRILLLDVNPMTPEGARIAERRGIAIHSGLPPEPASRTSAKRKA